MEKSKDKKKKSKIYEKPKMKSEPLQVYGAICNGQATLGRKDTTGSPNFCTSGKLLS